MATFLPCVKLHPWAKLPTRGTAQAIGVDLYSVHEALVPPHNRLILDTGIAMAIPECHYGRIAERSGQVLAGLHIGAGVVDSDYRGSVKVIIYNTTDYPKLIKREEKVAQLILERASYAVPIEVQALSITGRGIQGFGSTDLPVPLAPPVHMMQETSNPRAPPPAYCPPTMATASHYGRQAEQAAARPETTQASWMPPLTPAPSGLLKVAPVARGTGSGRPSTTEKTHIHQMATMVPRAKPKAIVIQPNATPREPKQSSETAKKTEAKSTTGSTRLLKLLEKTSSDDEATSNAVADSMFPLDLTREGCPTDCGEDSQ